PRRQESHGDEAPAAGAKITQNSRTFGAGTRGSARASWKHAVASSAGSTAAPATDDLHRGCRAVRTRPGDAAAARLQRRRRVVRIGAPAIPGREGAARTRPPLPEHLRAPGDAEGGRAPNAGRTVVRRDARHQWR